MIDCFEIGKQYVRAEEQDVRCLRCLCVSIGVLRQSKTMTQGFRGRPIGRQSGLVR